MSEKGPAEIKKFLLDWRITWQVGTQSQDKQRKAICDLLRKKWPLSDRPKKLVWEGREGGKSNYLR